MINDILGKIKKHKVKSSVIGIFVFMFLAGFIPKVTRDIIAWNNAKSYEYVALYENPKIESGDSTLELSGELKPYLHTEIFSRINGIIKKRYVELGDKVVQGQLLATIDSPDLDEEGQSDIILVNRAMTGINNRQMAGLFQNRNLMQNITNLKLLK